MVNRLVLSGGIGSGKSSAARIFASLGASVLPADEFAREVLAPGTKAAERVIELWPEVAEAGVVNRLKLGRIVFRAPEELRTLEEITHPPTRTALLDAVHKLGDSAVVLVEMPILRDWFAGWTVVVVDAPDSVRLSRAITRDDRLGEAEVRAIMARQPSRSEWLLAADLVVDNNGGSEALKAACGAVWEHLTDD